MENTNTVRVTKSQKLSAIRDLIPADACVNFPGTDERSPYIFDHGEIVAFLDKELEALAKKNNRTTKTPKEQAEEALDEEYKNLIYEFLYNLPSADEDGKPIVGATCTDILHGVPKFYEDKVTNQKISPILKKMMSEGTVGVKKIKSRNHFFIEQ